MAESYRMQRSNSLWHSTTKGLCDTTVISLCASCMLGTLNTPLSRPRTVSPHYILGNPQDSDKKSEVRVIRTSLRTAHALEHAVRTQYKGSRVSPGKCSTKRHLVCRLSSRRFARVRPIFAMRLNILTTLESLPGMILAAYSNISLGFR